MYCVEQHVTRGAEREVARGGGGGEGGGGAGWGGRVVKALDSASRGCRFESRFGHQPFLLIIRLSQGGGLRVVVSAWWAQFLRMVGSVS